MKKNLFNSSAEEEAALSLREEEHSGVQGTRENPYSVSDINRKVKFELESKYPGIWITGEISNFNAHHSGHYYFSLKDEFGQIAAVMFFQSNRKLKFVPEDGLEILAFGKLSLYAPRGAYQVIINEMEPKGIGSLQFAYEQLKKKLDAEGLFDESRKKEIPSLPHTVGIITSPTGAAIRDLISILNEINIGILIFPSRVQGDEAAEEIITGLKTLNTVKEIDLLIVGRGGGSIEDLWPFNEERVARAIADSHIPVITAIGHETDFTIADFVSDLRAPTPSAAAAFIVQKRRELEGLLDKHLKSLTREARIFIAEKSERISRVMHRRGILGLEGMIREKIQNADEYSRRLSVRMNAVIQDAVSKWQLANSNLSLRRIKSHLQMNEQSFKDIKTRLLLSMKQLMKNSSAAFSRISSLLHSLSPLSILKRGYSICRTAVGEKIVRRSSEVSEGECVDVRLYKGSLLCEIKERHDDQENNKT